MGLNPIPERKKTSTICAFIIHNSIPKQLAHSLCEPVFLIYQQSTLVYQETFVSPVLTSRCGVWSHMNYFE